MRKILAKRLLGACGSARTSWTGSTILIFFTAYKYLCKTVGQAPCPSPLGAPLGAHPSPALPGGAGQGGSHAALHLERVFRARLVKYLRAHGLCCRLPRNPPVNSCHSSAPSPELPRPPPMRGLRVEISINGGAKRGEGGGDQPRAGSFRSRPLLCAPKPHRRPWARPCPGSPAGPCPLARMWCRRTRLLSLQDTVVKSRWKIGRFC